MKNILKIITNRLIIVGLALLLQLTWVVISMYKVSAYSNAVGILMVVLGIVVVMRIVSKNDNPAYKLAWSTLISCIWCDALSALRQKKRTEVHACKGRSYS